MHRTMQLHMVSVAIGDGSAAMLVLVTCLAQLMKLYTVLGVIQPCITLLSTGYDTIY
jgi:hypothetical protein